MQTVTFSQKFRYWFDNTMSKGPVALIAWLGLASAVMIAVIAFSVQITGLAPAGDDGSKPGFIQLAWMSLMRTLDAGTMGGDAGNWPFLLMMLAVTMGGIFIVSTLIGILTSGIEGKIEELRKGRSRIVETHHTVILGWSPHIVSIVQELSIANENQKRPCVAILADKDKVEMEDEIRSKVGDTGKTRVVCRSGNPADPADLEIASLNEARSIIILGPESDNPDSQVIKTALAIINGRNRRKEPYHIVAEIQDPKNMEVARMVGGDELQLVLGGDLISRITVQTCLQSGLSLVYTELLDFGGDEIYFQEEPGLVGKSYGDALLAYEDSALMGICDKDGAVKVNPPMDTKIEAGDRIIAISQDDDTVRISDLKGARADINAFSDAMAGGRKPTRVLLLGWNWRGEAIVNGLDDYAAPGSEVTIAGPEVHLAGVPAFCERKRKNLKVAHRFCDTEDRAALDALRIVDYEHIITLSYSDAMDAQRADACTLVTLLHLRDMAAKSGKRFTITSEMQDVRNRELAQVTNADDFIVSDKMVALMLSQLSENKKLEAVFNDLFHPEGSEIYLKPATRYVKPGTPVNFYTIVESAKRYGETAIGYRLVSQMDDPENAFGVKVNPKKSATLAFSADDKIIVLAEDA